MVDRAQQIRTDAPYGYTLSKSEIDALIAYIRLISDPPYRASGMVYAKP